MSELGLVHAKIVGMATEVTWSQVHTFFPSEEEKRKKRGHLLAAFSLTGLGEGVEVVGVGREIIARLHEEYFGNLEGGVLKRLKEAITKISAEIEPPAKLEIGAAVVLDETLYLVISGRGRAILRRKGKIGTVLIGSDAIESSSGYLDQGDLFILGTAGFFSLISEGVLRAALETDSPREVADNLAPVVHGREVGGGEVAIVVKIKVLEKEKLVESEEEERPVKPSPELDVSILERLKRTAKLDFPALLAKANLLVEKGLALIQVRLGKRAVYLAKEKPRRQQKTIFTIALVLFLLLGVSVVLGMRQRSYLARQEKRGPLLEQARQKVDEGKALLDLNPMRSRQLLLEANELIEKMESESGESPQLASFKQELETLLASVLRERELEEAPVFLDLALIKEGAGGDKMAATGDQMIILDKKETSIYGVGISQKSSKVLAGGKLIEGATGVAAFGEKVFILTPKGVVEANKASGEQVLRLETDEEWGEIADLFAYGGNLYLLDRKGAIWKYSAIEGGLGAKQSWIRGGMEPDFSDAVSMAIDGSIWVLKSDGAILKYTQGGLEAFGLAGLDKPFSRPEAIYTDDEQEKIYILDKGNLRVVVVDKSGEYNSAYIWPGVSGVSDVIASEAEKKILLLSGSRIYEIEIK